MNKLIAWISSVKKSEWISFATIVVFSLGFLGFGVFEAKPIFYFWCMVIFFFSNVHEYRRGLNDGVTMANEVWESFLIREILPSKDEETK